MDHKPYCKQTIFIKNIKEKKKIADGQHERLTTVCIAQRFLERFSSIFSSKIAAKAYKKKI
jgi:hypothetical protein